MFRKVMFGLVLVSFSATVAAQGYDDGADIYLGFRGGFIEVEDVDDDGSLNLGVSAGWMFSRYMALEGSVDYQKTDLVFFAGPVAIQVPLVERKTTAVQLGVNLTPFPDGWFRPFASAGVGYYWSDFTFDDPFIGPDSEGDTGSYLGAGLELFNDGSRAGGFSLVLESRWLFTREEIFDDEPLSDGFTSTIGAKFKF